MLLHEIFSLFESIDHLISEGFKDDMFKQYPEDVENKDFKAAITAYNSDPKLKEALKHAVKPQGNIAVSIKKQCPTGADFITLINSLISNAKDKEEYKQLKQGTVSAGETDYWMIPCHTFKEAHDAAFKYAGNLPRLSKEEITNKYGIDTPQPGTFYNTNKTPEEFLEYMKNEDRFFMAPSWCVAADDYYFTERYNLATEPHEKPKCYIIISKKYPNVRFCITLEGDGLTIEGDAICRKAKLQEVRDPWQIGGTKKKAGLEMMSALFGENEVKKILQKVQNLVGHKKISDIVNGESLFENNLNIVKLDKPFSNLKNGYSMFKYCTSLEEFKSDLPALVDGNLMFMGCTKLTEFSNNDLSSLKRGGGMFSNCEELWSFDIEKMPSLEDGYIMFMGTKLWIFNTDMPKLNYGPSMFSGCNHLRSFVADTPALKNGSSMFEGCTKLSLFDGNLSSLENAWDMFNGCKLPLSSIENILRTINRNGNGQVITIGYDKSISDEDIEKLRQKFEKLNWKADFKPSKS